MSVADLVRLMSGQVEHELEEVSVAAGLCALEGARQRCANSKSQAALRRRRKAWLLSRLV